MWVVGYYEAVSFCKFAILGFSGCAAWGLGVLCLILFRSAGY